MIPLFFKPTTHPVSAGNPTLLSMEHVLVLLIILNMKIFATPVISRTVKFVMLIAHVEHALIPTT